MLLIRVLLAASMALVVASCAAVPAPPTELKMEVVKSLQRYKKEYVLQPGDQLEVSVYHVPELAHTVTVRPDGYVSLQILNDVKASGLTVPEFDAELSRLYSERLVNPEVTVIVANPRGAVVYVVGDVNRPGPVSVRDAPTAAIAIAASGGTARTAA